VIRPVRPVRRPVIRPVIRPVRPVIRPVRRTFDLELHVFEG
jgi:hypothetical protein